MEEILERTLSLLSISHLVEHLSDPVILLDLAHRVVQMNEAAESFLGRSSQECAGQSFEALLSKSYDATTLDQLNLALRRCGGGAPSKINVLFDTPRHVEHRCSLLPSMDGHGALDGILLLVGEERQPEGGRGEADPYEMIKVLASTSLEIMEGTDLKEMIETETSRLIRSLGLDFAIFRIISPQEHPQLICTAIEPEEATLLLDHKLDDGTPLYQSVNRGQDMIIEDLQSSDLQGETSDVRSMACLNVNWSEWSYGCAVFGNRRLGGDLGLLFPILQVFCNHVAISLRNARLQKELIARKDLMQGLFDTTQALSSTLELSDLLHTILQTARNLVGADNCYIFQIEKGRERLKAISQITEASINEVPELEVGEGITGLVAQSGKGQLVERADRDPRAFTIPGTPEDDPSSIICVPLKVSDMMLGVMTLEKRPGLAFTKKQYEVIELFSHQAAVAIHRASQYDMMRGFATNLQVYNVLLTHDIANFNVPIHGFLEMLIKDPKLDPRQRRYVRSALVQSDNISEVITDIREMTRLRSKVGDAPLDIVNLVPVLKEAREDLLSNAVNEDVETHFDTVTEVAKIRADASLKMVFHNLLAQACKYSMGRPVEIHVMEHNDASGEWWKVCIKDAGKGIPDEQKEAMFKRYDRLDTAHGSDGHGLSMSVVATLIERYHGQVWVEDRVPGDHSRGASYNVIFPKVMSRGHAGGMS